MAEPATAAPGTASPRSDPGRAAFIQLSRSWYYEAARERPGSPLVDDVTFGVYYDQGRGGTRYEASVQWHALSNREPPSCRVVVWDDAFEMFADFGAVFAALAQFGRQTVTPEQVCELLRRHGFQDATEAAPPPWVPGAEGEGEAGGPGRQVRRSRPGRSRRAGDGDHDPR